MRRRRPRATTCGPSPLLPPPPPPAIPLPPLAHRLSPPPHRRSPPPHRRPPPRPTAIRPRAPRTLEADAAPVRATVAAAAATSSVATLANCVRESASPADQLGPRAVHHDVPHRPAVDHPALPRHLAQLHPLDLLVAGGPHPRPSPHEAPHPNPDHTPTPTYSSRTLTPHPNLTLRATLRSPPLHLPAAGGDRQRRRLGVLHYAPQLLRLRRRRPQVRLWRPRQLPRTASTWVTNHGTGNSDRFINNTHPNTPSGGFATTASSRR